MSKSTLGDWTLGTSEESIAVSINRNIFGETNIMVIGVPLNVLKHIASVCEKKIETMKGGYFLVFAKARDRSQVALVTAK